MIRFYSNLAKVNNTFNYAKGKKLNGYLIRNVERIPELNLSFIDLVHEKTNAKHVHLCRPNDNMNTFLVSFRTAPKNNTGVAHILEHLSLCGSQKYPCRDPFMNMLSRSLSSNMNAFTMFDCTAYHFSTINSKDFENLLDIYLDSTFFPLLKKDDFLQEGWRLEPEDLKDKDSKLKIKGVVFNEMKDIYVNVDNIFLLKLIQNILCDTIYFNDFGGHPFNICELDINETKFFHQTYYHPTNAKFFTYGNLPIEFYLSKINNVLQNFERNESYKNISFIKSQKRWKKPKSLTVSCPSDLFDSDLDKQITYAKSYLLVHITDNYENFVLNILSNLLVDGQNSPFYKSLIDSNLGIDFSPGTGYIDDMKQSLFSVGLRNIKEENISEIDNLIDDTFAKVAEEGISKERIDSILHSIELSIRHDTSKFGFNLIKSLNLISNHDGNLFEALKLNENVKRFKKNLEEDASFLQNLVRKYFLNNNHCLKLTMKPNKNFIEEFNLKQDEILEKKVSHLSKDEKYKIYQDCLELSKNSLIQNNEILPCLNVNTDVSKKLVYPSSIELTKLNQSIDVQIAAQHTNELVYFRSLFKLDINELPEDLLVYLPVFCSVITNLGAGELNRKQLTQKIELKTSGLNINVHLNSDYSEGKNVNLNILLNSYCLEKNLEEMLGLWECILNSANFNEDPKHLLQLISMQAARDSQNIVFSGHQYAALRSSHNINAINNIKEKLTGVEFIRNLNEISKNVSIETIIKNLKSLFEIVFDKKKMKLALNAEPKNVQNSLKLYEKFVNNLREPTLKVSSKNFKEQFTLKNNVHEHIIFPYNSYYVSKSLQCVPFLHQDYAKYQLLANILFRKFIHQEIRVKGSAYGSFVTLNTNGVLSFASYRDPNIKLTLDVFNKSFDWLLNQSNLTDQDINEAKLDAFKTIDKPITASNHGMNYFLDNLTDEMINNYRLAIFDINKNEIIDLVKNNLDKLLKTSGVACLGPSNEATKKAPWKLLN